MVRIQQSPLGVQSAIKNTASQDGVSVRIGIEQDPGQAGVSEADYLVRMLQGYNVKTVKATKDKVTRALPASSQAKAGNIKILQAPWNEDFFRELENFPEGAHDDIVDALSGAFLLLNESAYDLTGLNPRKCVFNFLPKSHVKCTMQRNCKWIFFEVLPY